MAIFASSYFPELCRATSLIFFLWFTPSFHFPHLKASGLGTLCIFETQLIHGAHGCITNGVFHNRYAGEKTLGCQKTEKVEWENDTNEHENEF